MAWGNGEEKEEGPPPSQDKDVEGIGSGWYDETHEACKPDFAKRRIRAKDGPAGDWTVKSTFYRWPGHEEGTPPANQASEAFSNIERTQDWTCLDQQCLVGTWSDIDPPGQYACPETEAKTVQLSTAGGQTLYQWTADLANASFLDGSYTDV